MHCLSGEAFPINWWSLSARPTSKYFLYVGMSKKLFSTYTSCFICFCWFWFHFQFMVNRHEQQSYFVFASLNSWEQYKCNIKIETTLATNLTIYQHDMRDANRFWELLCRRALVFINSHITYGIDFLRNVLHQYVSQDLVWVVYNENI